MKIGERVGVVLSATPDEVRMLGFGTYAGEEVPAEGCGGWIGETLREYGRNNPKLQLDNGDVVYGCECWWGPEAEVRKRFMCGRTIVEVSITDARKAAEARANDAGSNYDISH